MDLNGPMRLLMLFLVGGEPPTADEQASLASAAINGTDRLSH